MSNNSVFVPRGARRSSPSGAPGNEEGFLGRLFPAINRRATIGMSLRDVCHLSLIGAIESMPVL
jgi:hypothetical protein